MTLRVREMVKERSKFFQLNKEFREDMIGNDYAENVKLKEERVDVGTYTS